MSSLHPDVRQLVATLATNPPAAPWDVSITAYREAGERLAVLAGLPDDGCAVTELAIPVRRGSVDARHYRPPGGTVCPAVVYLHGGGFVRGSLDSHDRLCRALCVRGGLHVVAVAYRLEPAGPFLTREALAWSYDQYVPDVDDRRSARASPLFEETLADAPPSIIISAQIDPVADDARRYAEALAAAGVAVDTHEYAGMPHSFMLLAGMLEDGDHALTTLANGLAELLNAG